MRTLFFFLIFLVGLAGFVLFYAVPWLGEKAASIVPVDTEVELGENLSKVYAVEGRAGDSTNYYMQEFVNHLDLDDTYEIDATVIKSEDINAFALPGGKIFIYTGILDRMHSYEELVALLGHEVTHVANRHSLKSICRSAATGLAISAIFGDVQGISGIILAKADEFKQLDYSRELETEADDNGLELMIRNKVNPKGMLGLLQVLKDSHEEMPQFMKYLSTHPDTDSRIENVSARPGIKTEFEKNKKLDKLFRALKGSL